MTTASSTGSRTTGCRNGQTSADHENSHERDQSRRSPGEPAGLDRYGSRLMIYPRRQYPGRSPDLRREGTEEGNSLRSDFFDTVASAEGADHSLAHELGKVLMTHHLEAGRGYC